MEFDRVAYTVLGAAKYSLDKLRRKPTGSPRDNPQRENPHIVFTFWDAPTYPQSVALMYELHSKFGENGLPIGAGLFVRPMGDIKTEDDYSYDPTKLENFLRAAAYTYTPVFIITSGMHWTEVAYKKSPLLRMLEASDGNLMRYEDGTRVQRKLQPPGGFLDGHFGSDRNGVLYLSQLAPEVKRYRERNLDQMAKVVGEFAGRYPNLFLGISTENEVDYPGKWITGGKKVDGGADNTLRQFTIARVLRRNVEIFLDAGIPVTRIYTNQSVEDEENRASPLSTANIPDSNIGITAWRTGKFDLYRRARNLAQERGKRWALILTNPLSLDQRINAEELTAAIECGPDIIGLYNWWPHFWGYGIRGMPLEKAVQTFTR